MFAALLLALAQTGVMIPPPDWIAAPLPPPHGNIVALGAWVRPARGHVQNIVLHQMPLTDKTPAAFAAARVAALTKVATDVTTHPESLCGGELSGWYVEYEVTLGDHASQVEQTVAPGPGVMFTATYTRGNDEPEDRAARKALTTLCVR